MKQRYKESSKWDLEIVSWAFLSLASSQSRAGKVQVCVFLAAQCSCQSRLSFPIGVRSLSVSCLVGMGHFRQLGGGAGSSFSPQGPPHLDMCPELHKHTGLPQKVSMGK